MGKRGPGTCKQGAASICRSALFKNDSRFPGGSDATKRDAVRGCLPRSGRGNIGGHLQGAEIMLNDFDCHCPIYIACGYTDLRRGIDGLAGMVTSQFQMDPFQTALFLFCGRKRDRIKALYWEGDDFLLLYKRLESGSFQWPRSKDEVQALTPQQYRWLMEGLKTEQPKANRTVSGLSMI